MKINIKGRFREIFFANMTADTRYKKLFKSKIQMGENIYGGKVVGDYAQKFSFIHLILKYKLLLPFLGLLKFFYGKHLSQKIEDKPYNKNMIIFDKTFDKTIVDWHMNYLNRDIPGWYEDYTRTKDTKYIFERKMSVLLVTLKELMITMVMNDTAYKEFFNMLLHNIAHAMLEEYKGKKVRHIMYNSQNIYDYNYFVATRLNEICSRDMTQKINLMPFRKKPGTAEPSTATPKTAQILRVENVML